MMNDEWGEGKVENTEVVENKERNLTFQQQQTNRQTIYETQQASNIERERER